eukprot:522026-Ditylum_brightwellii.AAC.1
MKGSMCQFDTAPLSALRCYCRIKRIALLSLYQAHCAVIVISSGCELDDAHSTISSGSKDDG